MTNFKKCISETKRKIELAELFELLQLHEKTTKLLAEKSYGEHGLSCEDCQRFMAHLNNQLKSNTLYRKKRGASKKSPAEIYQMLSEELARQALEEQLERIASEEKFRDFFEEYDD